MFLFRQLLRARLLLGPSLGPLGVGITHIQLNFSFEGVVLLGKYCPMATSIATT